MTTEAEQIELEILRCESAMLRQSLARSQLLPFVTLTKPDYHVGWFHKLLAGVLDRFVRDVEQQKSPRLMLFVPPQHGKALGVDTPIPTPVGFRPIGDMRVGDVVFSETGAPCTVTATYRWPNRPVYKVITDDHDEIIADAEHEWPVRLCRKHQVVHVKTTRFLAERSSPRNPMVQPAGPIVTQPAALPIGPYTLGAWLGDGASNQATISKPDTDCIHLRDRIEAEGLVTSGRTTRDAFGVLGLLTLLKANNLLGNKHIPEAYLWASIEQRRALLQGLIDTDGHIDPKGQVEFCSMDRCLADGVQHLVRSLGVKASLCIGRATLNGVDHGEKYRVMFYYEHAASLPRKAANARKAKKSGRYLTFEPAGTAETVCITVDSPSHLYLCGRSMTPTHNSEQVSRRLPPFVLGRHPDWHWINASYNSKLARKFGRDVRTIMEGQRYRNVFPGTEIGVQDSENTRRGSHAVDELTLTKGGSYLSVGLGGMTTGLPAHIFGVDDPVKGFEQADSEVECENAIDWFLGTANTRLKRGGGVLITQTRWGDNDLSGQLLRIAEADPEATQWEIVRFPAIAMEDEYRDGQLIRRAGEALCEDMHPVHELVKTRATMIAAGREREWNSIYQQNPTPEGGTFYRDEDFATYSKVPKVTRNYITTDLALSSKTTADWTVILPGGVDPEDDLYLLPGMIRKRMDALETACRILVLANEIDAQLITLPADHMGKTLEPFLTKLMDGASETFRGETLVIPRRWYTIELMPVVQDKQTRSSVFQARQRQGKVYWRRTPEFAEIIKPEFLRFPLGEHDDVCDAAADMGRLIHKLEAARKPVVEAPKFKPPSRWKELDGRKRGSDAYAPKPLFGEAPTDTILGDL